MKATNYFRKSTDYYLFKNKEEIELKPLLECAESRELEVSRVPTKMFFQFAEKQCQIKDEHVSDLPERVIKLDDLKAGKKYMVSRGNRDRIITLVLCALVISDFIAVFFGVHFKEWITIVTTTSLLGCFMFVLPVWFSCRQPKENNLLFKGISQINKEIEETTEAINHSEKFLKNYLQVNLKKIEEKLREEIKILDDNRLPDVLQRVSTCGKITSTPSPIESSFALSRGNLEKTLEEEYNDWVTSRNDLLNELQKLRELYSVTD